MGNLLDKTGALMQCERRVKVAAGAVTVEWETDQVDAFGCVDEPRTERDTHAGLLVIATRAGICSITKIELTPIMRIRSQGPDFIGRTSTLFTGSTTGDQYDATAVKLCPRQRYRVKVSLTNPGAGSYAITCYAALWPDVTPTATQLYLES